MNDIYSILHMSLSPSSDVTRLFPLTFDGYNIPSTAMHVKNQFHVLRMEYSFLLLLFFLFLSSTTLAVPVAPATTPAPRPAHPKPGSLPAANPNAPAHGQRCPAPAIPAIYPVAVQDLPAFISSLFATSNPPNTVAQAATAAIRDALVFSALTIDSKNYPYLSRLFSNNIVAGYGFPLLPNDGTATTRLELLKRTLEARWRPYTMHTVVASPAVQLVYGSTTKDGSAPTSVDVTFANQHCGGPVGAVSVTSWETTYTGPGTFKQDGLWIDAWVRTKSGWLVEHREVVHTVCALFCILL